MKTKELFRKNIQYYKDTDYENALFESSISRVWQHSFRGFIMMSAFIGRAELKENMKRHENLKSRLKKLQLGFFEVNGVYKYDDGHTEDELSVFIPYRDIYTWDEFVDIAKQLRNDFDQESVIVKEPDENAKGEGFLIYKNKTVSIGKNLSIMKIGKAYSELRKGPENRTFVIESIRVPSNHISAYGMTAENILY